MASDRSQRGASDVLWLGRGEKPSTVERIAVLAIIGVIIGADVFGLIFTPGADVARSLVSITSTAVLAVFLWSPLIASITLAAVFALSFAVNAETQVLTVIAVAVGLVARSGRMSLILSYVGGFLLASAVIAYGDTTVPVNLGIYLILAAMAGAIGFALRIALARGRRLEQQLVAAAEQERQAVLAERRWIAGELHDSIAHHLTVVSLHVQMIDDPKVFAESQEAIRVAARKAMTDLRFVIELADDGPRSAGAQTGDLAASLEEAESEFRAAGHDVVSDGDPRDMRIARSVEIILARVVRESATNILKHAGAGPIEMHLKVDDEAADLRIVSPLPATPRRDLPSSGTGIGRMAERVLGASGEFTAGAVEGRWCVHAHLPIVREVASERSAGEIQG